MLRLMRHLPGKWRPITYYDREGDTLYQGWWGWGYKTHFRFKNGKGFTIRVPEPFTRMLIRNIRNWLEKRGVLFYGD